MLLLTLHQLWHLGALPAPTAMFSASPTPVSTLLLPSRFISCTSCLNFSTGLCLLSWKIPLDTTIWVLDAGIPTGCQVNQSASGHLCLTQLSTCGSDVFCSRPPRQTLQPLPLLPPAMKNLVPPALCPADSEFQPVGSGGHDILSLIWMDSSDVWGDLRWPVLCMLGRLVPLFVLVCSSLVTTSPSFWNPTSSTMFQSFSYTKGYSCCKTLKPRQMYIVMCYNLDPNYSQSPV